MSESRFEHWFPDRDETEADARSERWLNETQDWLALRSASSYAKEVVECRWSGDDCPAETIIAVREKGTVTVTIFAVAAELTVLFTAMERKQS